MATIDPPAEEIARAQARANDELTTVWLYWAPAGQRWHTTTQEAWIPPLAERTAVEPQDVPGPQGGSQ